MFNQTVSRKIFSSIASVLLFSNVLDSNSAIASSPVSAQAVAGEIISVGDGDTIRAKTAGKILTIRLACVDAPEMKQQPYGAAAASRLKQLLPVGLPVSLTIGGKDIHGRTVAKVFAGSTSINLSLVQEGQAAVYPQYLKECPDLRDRLLSAEASAKAQRLGLWNQNNPVMPWVYRRTHLAKSSSAPQSGKSPTRPSARSSTPQADVSGSSSRFDWSKAQQDIDAGRYSNGVNSIDGSDGGYSGSSSSSSSGGSCNNPSNKDSAGRSCGGRAASKRPGGR
jgi:endonuclease YncB( thermonuclease family)